MSELATDYLERALPFRQRMAAWVHLALCHACRRYFDQMRHTVALMAGGPRRQPPARVEQDVLAALADQARSAPARDGDA